MTPLDVLFLVLSALVVVVLIEVADHIGKASDDNDYNNEQGSKDDPARQLARPDPQGMVSEVHGAGVPTDHGRGDVAFFL